MNENKKYSRHTSEHQDMQLRIKYMLLKNKHKKRMIHESFVQVTTNYNDVEYTEDVYILYRREVHTRTR